MIGCFRSGFCHIFLSPTVFCSEVKSRIFSKRFEMVSFESKMFLKVNFSQIHHIYTACENDRMSMPVIIDTNIKSIEFYFELKVSVKCTEASIYIHIHVFRALVNFILH